MNFSRRQVHAVILFAWTFALSILVQAQNVWRFVAEPDRPLSSKVVLLGALFGAQGQNLAVAIFVGFLIYAGWRRVGLRIAVFGLAILINLITVLDQISYRLYFQHFRIEMGDGGIPPFQLLMDSLQSEIDLVLVVDFGVLLLLPVIIYFLLHKFCLRNLLARHLQIFAMVISMWCGVCFWLQPRFQNSPAIPINPFVSMIESVLFQSSSQAALNSFACAGSKSQRELYSLWHGSPTPLKVEARRAMDHLISLSEGHPNIVLIVLESVGAVSLLDYKHRLDATITPNLYQLSQEAILFPRVYDLAAGTARSHLPLHTGGSTSTAATIFQEMGTPYQGATLSGEFSRGGYETSFFSAQYLTFENMDTFYGQLPFDYRLTPETEARAGHPLPELNSWGVEEDALRQKVSDWISQRKSLGKGKRRPFFLEFATLATHHPYTAPKSFKGLPDTGVPIARYRRALQYSDSVLGNLLQSLRDSGEWENTIVAVMGDHGEAFGDRHPRNFLHGNFIYEENIRNLLLIRGPGLAAVQDERRVFIGDVAPTLLGLAGLSKQGLGVTMLGKNLLDRDYLEKIRFFHKSISPARWGLVDGNWKYIGAQSSFEHPELYDLSVDPFERKNLADLYPDHISEYECRVHQWYLDTQKEYFTHIKGLEYLATNKNDFALAKQGGARALNVGMWEAKGGFHVKDHFSTTSVPVVQVDWVPTNDAKFCEFRWISPEKKIQVKRLMVPLDVNRAEFSYPGLPSLAPGEWQVEFSSKPGGPVELQSHFKVAVISP